MVLKPNSTQKTRIVTNDFLLATSDKRPIVFLFPPLHNSRREEERTENIRAARTEQAQNSGEAEKMALIMPYTGTQRPAATVHTDAHIRIYKHKQAPRDGYNKMTNLSDVSGSICSTLKSKNILNVRHT